ncbi:MAG: phospholipid/cholesterol/gamma-HCH transport system substrate-binding protein [Solirubrobacterales bacterium]|jgi:virulence factor Mce-like protein|nr:phospholipid/cholesterol/gamma-HCH transport system substrate-binding protein [Solirubrobacterales bacterium]
MRRNVGSTLAASPTMVGSITVLIAVVAVFLAYNANSGLPFVPTYNISADLPSANSLVPGNEVRIGGVRVGVVSEVTPVSHEDGSVTARFDMTLDEDAEPIPVDSEIVIRARSALGLQYLEINKGTSDEGYEAGATIPVTSAVPEPVEFDDVLSTFDEPTRVAIQANLVEFGNALAGRGVDLNGALGELPETVKVLEPVAKNLSDPDTQLVRFIDALAATAAEVAPVAEEQAQMFVALDTTFGAFANVARPFIQETISETPPTLDVGTRALPVIRPFLANSAGLFRDLQPGIDAIVKTSPAIADALEVGAPVLRRSVKFNEQLAPTAAALRSLNDDADARNGIDRLIETSKIADPTLKFITPAQTVCNYGAILFDNLQSLFSQGTGPGTWQRAEVIIGPVGQDQNDPVQASPPNNEGSPSSAPANGGGNSATNFLHTNPYPNTAAPGQELECEAGNEGWLTGQQVIGNVPGNQGTHTRETFAP